MPPISRAEPDQDERQRLPTAPLEEPAPQIPPGGGTPRSPYPDYDVAARDKWALDWDEKTRRVVLDRMGNVPAYRFFEQGEAVLLEALCDRLMPQDDRAKARRVPIAPFIDQRLHKGEGDGYRYAGTLSDREAYRIGLVGVNQTARSRFHQDFVSLNSQ